MKRFVQAQNRSQCSLLPESVDDFITEDNPVRVIDVFVDELDLRAIGFEGAEPEPTGRPAYHPSTMLKIYIYGYLNRVQSSRRLERETQRNLELIWLTGRLSPDFKNGLSEGQRCSNPQCVLTVRGTLPTVAVVRGLRGRD